MTAPTPAAPAPARRGMTRRTLARGAAWTAPIAALSVPAPTYAASPGTFTIDLNLMDYGGTDNYWRFFFRFLNTTAAPVQLMMFEIYTTYHAPATNSTSNAVFTQSVSSVVPAHTTLTLGSSFQRGKGWTEPPKANGVSLLPGYYNDFDAADADGTIPCTDGFVLASSPDYPAAGRRLVADDTYALWFYDAGDGEVFQRVETPAPLRVVDGCITRNVAPSATDSVMRNMRVGSLRRGTGEFGGVG